jgi:chromosome partitioning protein
LCELEAVCAFAPGGEPLGEPCSGTRIAPRGRVVSARGAEPLTVYSGAAMATIAVLSQKGGTGKTTAVRTLTDIFRRIDLRVLAVDLDPQGNLSDYLDVDPEAAPTIGDVLSDRAKPGEAVHSGIIPANLGLAEAELALGGKMGRELSLKKALRTVKPDYDVILIDCPPALGLLTVNALVAADYALLSAEAQYFALQGVEQALEVIELARETLNPDLEWLGVMLNIADMRTRHSREAFDSLREHFGEKLLDTTIRASIAYAESAERAVSILDYRPDLATDYLNVADELLRRLHLEPARERLGALVRTAA